MRVTQSGGWLGGEEGSVWGLMVLGELTLFGDVGWCLGLTSDKIRAFDNTNLISS